MPRFISNNIYVFCFGEQQLFICQSELFNSPDTGRIKFIGAQSIFLLSFQSFFYFFFNLKCNVSKFECLQVLTQFCFIKIKAKFNLSESLMAYT